jgi:cobalt-zinc-cadmium efflux system membrane fusion protein
MLLKKTPAIKPIRGFLILAVISVLLSAGCKEKAESRETPAKYCLDEALKKQSSFYKATLSEISETLPLTGRIEYNPDKVVHFVTLVSGVITTTHFSLGDKVERGQLLAEIRSPELSSLEAERKTLKSQLLTAERQLEAVRAMYADGIASQKDLIEAQSRLDIITAELEKTKANMEIFSASGERGVFQIKAPVTGYIVDKNVAPGTQVSAGGAPLFTISDLSEVWAVMNIYTLNVVNIRENMSVDIKTPAYPNEVFTGHIRALSQVFDAEERVLKARVLMPNTDMRLKPGMLVDVLVKKESSEKAVNIPTEAIIFDDNRYFVLVYHDDCHMETREISILAKNNGSTYTGAGIQEGETIVSKNQLLIYEQIKNQ